MRIVQTFFILVVISLSSFFTHALEVSKVKGNKVLIQMDARGTLQPGEQFFVVNLDGKKKGIVVIKQVRDERAIAILAKGQAEPGWTLQRRNKKKKGQSESNDSSTAGTPHEKAYYGFQLGYAMNKMDVEQPGGPSVSLTGGTVTFRGMFDYELFEHIWFRGSLGYQPFNVTGSKVCDASSTPTFTSACNVNITYLSFDFWGRYLFASGFYRPWIGGGFSLLFPMSKTSSALEQSSITNTNIFSVGAGMDLFLTEKFFVPFQVEYGLFPKSTQVTANLISVRLGAGFTF